VEGALVRKVEFLCGGSISSGEVGLPEQLGGVVHDLTMSSIYACGLRAPPDSDIVIVFR